MGKVEKSLFIPAMIGIVAFIIVCASAYGIVLKGFLRVEQMLMERNIVRVQQLIHNQEQRIAINVTDWAKWDDAYNFVKDRNERFIQFNLTDEAILDLKLNMAIYFDREGNIVYSKYIDNHSGKTSPLPKEVKEIINRSGNILIRHNDMETVVSGVIMVSGTPMVIASSAVLTSKKQGPIEGYLIFGQKMDEAWVKDFSRIIALPMEFYDVGNDKVPEEVRKAENELVDKGKEYYGVLKNHNESAAYGLKRDIFGDAAFLFAVYMQRDVYSEGVGALGYFLFVLITVGCIFGIFFYVPLIIEVMLRKRSEARFKHVSENIGECIFEMDLTGKYIYVGPTIKKLLGYDKEEVVGKKYFYDFSPESEKEEVKKNAIDIFAKREAIKQMVVIDVKKDGRKIKIEISAAPVYDGRGRCVGYRGAGRDVTERERIKEELRASKEMADIASVAKSRFLANMSHEIRTPMNAVIGFAQLLSTTKLDDDQKKYVDMINSSGKVLLNVISDILDVSKIDAGRIVLEEMGFDLKKVINEVIRMFEPKIDANVLSLNYTIADNVPLRLVGDPIRLQQILINMTGNAVKFTKKGSISISCTLKERLPGGMLYLLFSVKDTGIGIAPEKIRNIFEPFVQADSSTTRVYGGTGLGLSICKKLVTLMDGEIWAESTPGVGSEFFFTVVQREETLNDREKRKDILSVAHEETIPNGIHILVAEDNRINMVLITEILKKFGCSVDAAVDGNDAVQKAMIGRYDMIFMDIQMPVMNGIEAAAAIRKTISKEVPIVALTATAMKEELDQAMACGMNDCIVKPINVIKLKEIIIKYAKNYRAC
ncbi:MAG TPA: ATP-binding protein [Candidatus Omnitrophota bacterium]|nr:ATP-binding protein [Candidatus Omnitrophota bacterium]HPS20386.1 ATP-binding protein [Candidatus Omnitrophota bacterium]